MKTLGRDKPLWILPFDHGGSFQTKTFGWPGASIAEQTAVFGVREGAAALKGLKESVS